MEKFKKAVRIILAVVVISGAVYAAASTANPTVVTGVLKNLADSSFVTILAGIFISAGLFVS